jgi:hypothetical protein
MVGVMVGVWLLLFQLVGVVDLNSPLKTASQSSGTDTTVSETESTYSRLFHQVVPTEGKTVKVVWGDMGQKLIAAGAVDLQKFEERYVQLTDEQRAILQGDSLQEITFTARNIQFWTNVLWALGLTQQSKVLGEGLMKQYESETPIGGYASTGGWTLGSKEATELYNSARLVELTPEQDNMVYNVAEHIFRPCCGNHTAFPDCNHGMAVLGLLELMASQGAGEPEMYQAALAFNSYSFSDNYITLAAFFEGQGVAWEEVDAATALGPQFSSAQGAQLVASQVGDISGQSNGGGGGCSA